MEIKRHSRIDLILLSVIFGCVCGIVAQAFLAVSPILLIALGIAILCVCVVFRNTPLLLIGVFFCAAAFGIWRADIARPDMRLESSVGSVVLLEGEIIDEPAEKPSGMRFTLDAGGVSVLVTAKKAPSLRYGDMLAVTGTLEKPENFETDLGTEFDYVSYLYKDDILYVMKKATVSVVSHGHGSWVMTRLLSVKRWIIGGFGKVFPSDEADLLAGLNLGEKGDISGEFRNELVTTGTIHIIALSGYNVSIIAGALRAFLADALGLAPRIAAFSGAFGIVLFVLMTGAQSSAVRAGIMALVSILARSSGRTYDAFRALMAAGFLMVLYDPKYLVYDVSFQLSFLATLGIVFVTPLLDRAFVRVPKNILWVIPLREALSVTLGAQLGVLPFILYTMGTLSFISLPANIVVLPAVPLAMGFGLLAGFIGSFSTILAYPIALATHALLSYMTGAIHFFANVPYAAVVITTFPLWLCVSFYVGGGLILFVAWKKKAAAPVGAAAGEPIR